jgi:hypothetical protein
VVKRCVVYIEGGGRGRIADNDFRRNWKTFLQEFHELARNNGYDKLTIVRGKDRGNTYRRFAKHQPLDDLCVLLVDAETAVPQNAHVWDVVANRPQDRWQRPVWATEKHLYLMVHSVETWLLTDPDALQRFFKKGFDGSHLPRTDLENRPISEIEKALEKATQNSQKGPYRHGQANEIIGLVDPAKVKALKRHGKRLFESLGGLIRDKT